MARKPEGLQVAHVAPKFDARYRASMEIRDTMREAYVQAGERGEHPISCRLRIGYIMKLAESTERVLGYRPKAPTSFLGLTIDVSPLGAPNELVTSAGTVVLPAPASIGKN